MPDLASALRNEITRIARKGVRTETTALKKASRAYRAEIAALKRRIVSLEQALRMIGRTSARVPAAASASDQPLVRVRFSAKGLAAHRERLGLSAADVGRLLGASGQSVYSWESGRARPRARHLVAIRAFRQLGKRQVAARLAELDAG